VLVSIKVSNKVIGVKRSDVPGENFVVPYMLADAAHRALDIAGLQSVQNGLMVTDGLESGLQFWHCDGPNPLVQIAGLRYHGPHAPQATQFQQAAVKVFVGSQGGFKVLVFQRLRLSRQARL
jgi:hypothetical protein